MIKHSPNIKINKSQTKNTIAPRKPIHINNDLSDMFLTPTNLTKQIRTIRIILWTSSLEKNKIN